MTNVVTAKSWPDMTLASGRLYSDPARAPNEPTGFGTFTVATSYTTDLIGNDGSVSSYRVWYPSGLTAPAPCVVMCGGLGNDQDQDTELTVSGTYVATDNHSFLQLAATFGFIGMAINPASPSGDGSTARGNALLNAANMLANENTRSGSPLNGKVQTTNMCALGHSMGGAGAFIAAQNSGNTRFQAVVALNPVPGAGETPSTLTKPILFITGQGDATANYASLYSAVPGSTVKVFAELVGNAQADFMHDAPRAPIGSLWTFNNQMFQDGAWTSPAHTDITPKATRIWDLRMRSLYISFLRRYLKSEVGFAQYIVNDASVLSSFSSANVA